MRNFIAQQEYDVAFVAENCAACFLLAGIISDYANKLA
jgi:hypothetical protein